MPRDDWGRALWRRGDFNHDGYADLPIDVPARIVGGSPSAGAVYVLYGSALGLSAPTVARQVWHHDISNVDGACEPSERFGSSSAAGKFNGPSYRDLAVGVPSKACTALG